MENVECKKNSVASIMLTYLDRISATVSLHSASLPQLKADLSPVTALDLALSELIEEIHGKHFKSSIFYSEEKFSDWGFPLFALDPLDGTREFVSGRPEWAISVGLITGPGLKGEGWIYNPKSGEMFPGPAKASNGPSPCLRGEVSRSEWESGLFTDFSGKAVELTPMGSIAYKLGRLSAGESDFVVSLRPKNIWDIAGGTLLCQEKGINFYSQGKLVTEARKLYRPPLIWCSEEKFSSLSGLFA